MSVDLSRFHAVDPALHAQALDELRRGRKQGHWMWFVFPQLRGLGHSSVANHYGLLPQEAAPYLADAQLRRRLLDATDAVQLHEGRRGAVEIFGTVDAKKLRSSMTLFAAQPGADPVFAEVLAAFCPGPCQHTLAVLAGVARQPRG